MPTSFVRRVPKSLLDRLAIAIGVRLQRRHGAISRASLPRFATAAPGLVLQLPCELRHPERIHLGRDVKIGPNSVLKLITVYPRAWMRHPDGDHVEQTFDPQLHIGDRVTASSALHLIVYDHVSIEDDVLLAGNVYISDGSHAIVRGDRPYKYQGIERVAPVRVGRGAWLGQNVVVLPGVTIGAYAVVGANAVVTRDVPAGSVAVGTPARVVRRWDAESETWVRPAAEPHHGDATEVAVDSEVRAP